MKKDSQDKVSKLVVVLGGNPNTGKTTLFNALTGLRQKVANYPGVTVDSKDGTWRIGDKAISLLIDLPGLYSIDPDSLDEEIASRILLGKMPNVPAPDVIVAIVDATKLERSLYLVTQLLDYKIPLIIALTMTDEAEKLKITIDIKKLSDSLQVPVIPVIVSKKVGIKELEEKVLLATTDDFPIPELDFLSHNSQKLNKNEEIFRRYSWINNIFNKTVTSENSKSEKTFSEKVDVILTHRFWGIPILVIFLLLIFQVVFSWSIIPMALLEQGFGALGDFVRNNLPEGILTDLITDGLIAGVGGVLIFLPQIALLFLFISIMEDTGYMARAAFLLDRLMRRVGLSGKAFLPLMSSYACWVPGIMATRTISNYKDRLIVILIIPFMSCTARLPVYTLIIASLFASYTVFGFISLGAVLMLAMYLLGIIMAIIIAWIFKRTILKSPESPFVMEIPPYRMPHFRTIFLNMLQRCLWYVKRVGTVILAASIILWALTYFPRDAAAITNNEYGNQLANSYAGQLGHVIEPIIEPLGWDWKIGTAVILSFAATEVFVSSLSIIYISDATGDIESEILISAIRNVKRPDGSLVWTPLTALTIMVFFSLSVQCMSTLALVRRETDSWFWALFMFGYITILGYTAAFLTYQLGWLLGFG